MSVHVQYDENKLAHQEPVHPISQWQEDNDALGIFSTRFEIECIKDGRRAEEYRKACRGIPRKC